MDQPGESPTIPPPTQQPPLDESSDSDDDPNMPALEEVQKELDAPPHGKNIKGIATEDDPTGGAGGASDEDEAPEESKDGWVDILNNGDLKKKTIKRPEASHRPQRGAKVLIRLITRLFESGEEPQGVTPEPTGPVVQGESFDEFTLVIGDNDLHQGLDLLLPLMDLGETARLLIKPRFGYGMSGNKSVGIPEDATLDLEVELLEIRKYSDDPFGGNPLGGSEPDPNEPNPIVMNEPLAERVRFGNYKKTRGNFWFERGEFSLAIQCYRGAIQFLDASEQELATADRVKSSKDTDLTQSELTLGPEVEDLLDKRAQTFNNLAAAQLKMQAYESALKSVESSLLLRPDNVKALYRRAKIRTERGDLDEAIADLKNASKLDPSSEAIAQELDRLNKVLARQLKEQRQLYRRMMQVKDEPEDEQKDAADSSKSSSGPSSSTKQSKSKQPSSKPNSWTSPATLSTAAGALLAAIAIPTLYAYFK